MGILALAWLSVPALADHIDARFTAVGPPARTTVIEAGVNHALTVEEHTRLVNAEGDVLVTGRRNGNTGALGSDVESGLLKNGVRLSTTYQKRRCRPRFGHAVPRTRKPESTKP